MPLPKREATSGPVTSRVSVPAPLRLTAPTTLRSAQWSRFNPNKLLLDPYAKLSRVSSLGRCALRIHDRQPRGRSFLRRARQRPFMVKGVVHGPDFRLGGRRSDPPSLDGNDHLRDACPRHDHTHPACRTAAGNVPGMASDRIIEHLTKLGVSAIELMPVQYFLDDRYLVERNLRNYWGYRRSDFLLRTSAILKGRPLYRIQDDGEAVSFVGIEF